MKNDEFDVIIIGAGIGGLVCGNFLVKAGLKVLIIEANANPGGYCNSFEVKGYQFDSFVHTLGNISKGSKLHTVFSELGIVDDLDLIIHDPTDIIYSSDCKITYWHSLEKTKQEFVKIFPAQAKGIIAFFNDVVSKKELDSVAAFRNKTFRQLLFEYVTDEKLISILSFMIYCDQGAPPSQISAFSAIKHYENFLINGGYYPRKGIQRLPNVLAEKFTKGGGELLFSRRVRKILSNNKNSFSVSDHKGDEYKSDFVVSDCDARTTFLQLVGKEKLNTQFVDELEKMKPSLTYFAIYIGLKDRCKELLPDGVNCWFICDYNYDKEHSQTINYNISTDNVKGFLICPNFKQKRMLILAHAPYKSDNFWKDNRSKYMDLIIDKADELVPGFKNIIAFKTAVTPIGLYKWTSNFQGAAYGWAAVPDQVCLWDFTRDAVIKNLYLCGHWSTLAAGVPGVSINGMRAAQIIARKVLPNYA